LLAAGPQASLAPVDAVRRFAALYAELDETTRTSVKVDALAAYFAAADPADAAWTVHFLGGNRPKRLIGARRLAAWAMEHAGVPEWLFDECYEAVGDLAETISLLLPGGPGSDLPLHRWVEERLLPLRGEDEATQRRAVLTAWDELDGGQLFLWNKLITGSFRVGVSQSLVVRALARVTGVDEPAIAHRMMGSWEPSSASFRALFDADTRDADLSRPYPFFLAYPLDDDPEALGDVRAWQAEWKWDGIRAQLVRRGGRSWLWSRGEELITERFPEIVDASSVLPDGTVVDGEILPWRDGAPLPFAQLQRRISRRKPGPKLLGEVPVVLLAYDLLEAGGDDLRERALAERRERLATLIRATPAAGRLLLSPAVAASSWDGVRAAQAAARERSAEGLMLKRLDAPYGVGRRKGGWWKWKVEPFTVDAVLIYAQQGHGRRAALYTDYTFGVWDGDDLVPFAKAYSGLADDEIRKVDAFVRRNTLERFGPVRTVRPELVFELAFEGIQRSARHRSGVAVRFPRMARWRTDKRAADADSLATVLALLRTP
jgi:DNA ligase 1